MIFDLLIKKAFVLLILVSCLTNCFGQLAAKKTLHTQRIEALIKIDGIFDEPAWQKASPAGDFIQLEPKPGVAPSQATEVKVVYDNKAIYIAANLLDEHPDSILRQIAQRDQAGIADYFGVVLDPYQDGQNGLGFIVTAAGVQIDIKYSTAQFFSGSGLIFRGDSNWDAVWDSKVRIREDGWAVEMRIPYSALRFPNVEEHLWNINFGRMIRRHREQSFWNEIIPEESGLLRQSGKLTGIQNIKSPVRLSATPFIALYAENNFDKSANPQSIWGKSINGGMDVKYGINDAFTLDLTLIPDFGEAQSDNQVLNLSPFEIQFNENRPFFTEGLELFSKGNLFYSRRVGGQPIHYGDVDGDLRMGLDFEGKEVALEEVISNPVTTQLYNATKISGRTTSGLGLGLFNATAAPSKAIIRNLESGEEREFETSSLTNYNVMVFDQNLKNNSFVSLVNTNVWRSGGTYDANVTGVVFNLNNKANSYSLSGKGALSQLYYSENTDFGHEMNIGLGKNSGQFNFELGYSEESDTYDRNDLGILFANNSREVFGNVSYNIYQPFGAFNNANFGLYTQYSRLYKPDEFFNFGINLWGGLQTKNFINFGMSTYFQPVEEYNYYQPQTDDFSRFYRMPKFINLRAYVSTDYRKKVALDVRPRIGLIDSKGRGSLSLDFAPRFRLSDKLFVLLGANVETVKKDEGYVTTLAVDEKEEIIFGTRDIQRLSLRTNINYNFTHNMNFSFRLNHNWSTVNYESFGALGLDGGLEETSFNDFSDINFNAFNIDAIYRWRFAPGSDLFVVWKNAILEESEINKISFSQNINRLFDQAQRNSFSLKLVYFLDYLNIVQPKGKPL